MNVRVLFFGQLKDMFRTASRGMDIPAASTVADLLASCRAVADPTIGATGHSAIWGSLAVAVNQEYASLAHPLAEGDEVALLPPVSGGSNAVTLTHERIDTNALMAAAKQGEDGALVIFDGIVRNNTRGRRTLYLDYEAYEAMALTQMERLVEDAKQQFAIRAVTLVHRLGKLEIGETSVLIIVASAHRGAAFDACRWVIDTLKKTVPIWKKEYFEDGAVWVAGEAFPEAIQTSDLTRAAGAA